MNIFKKKKKISLKNVEFTRIRVTKKKKQIR